MKVKLTRLGELTPVQRHGHPDFGWRDWLTRLRQRSRISFSRDRFDDKLLELQNRIDGLHNIRKHVERISADRSIAEHSTSQISDLTVPLFRVVQVASSSLHEVLSSLWQCGTPNQHFANMALNTKEEMATIEGNTQKVHFDLAWVCPAHMLGGSQIPLWLSIETFSERQTIMPVNHPPALQQRLEAVLGGLPTQQSNPPMASALLVPDLRTVPDLCRYLHSRSPSQPSATCDGFLQQNMTFKHLFYADHNGRAQGQDVKSLEDALKAARSNPECIPLPDKLNLAKLLALAVLRYHSTPWLKSGWGSQDVVFFSNEDFTCDPFPDPFLRSNIETRTSTTNQHLVLSNAGSHTTVTQSRSPIRNQTLYNLGVMLVELAYDSPLKDLQRPEDDQGDSHTLYWTATRLGDVVNRRLGPKYSSAVKICLYGGFGASTELEEAQVQKRFFDEVVLKLVTCAEAVKI